MDIVHTVSYSIKLWSLIMLNYSKFWNISLKVRLLINLWKWITKSIEGYCLKRVEHVFRLEFEEFNRTIFSQFNTFEFRTLQILDLKWAF